MEQSLAPGSQTFEQDLFRLYRENVIPLDEALSHADSPTNLSWLINNSQIGGGTKDEPEHRKRPAIIDFEATQPDGASFSEFSLNLDDH